MEPRDGYVIPRNGAEKEVVNIFAVNAGTGQRQWLRRRDVSVGMCGAVMSSARHVLLVKELAGVSNVGIYFMYLWKQVLVQVW